MISRRKFLGNTATMGVATLVPAVTGTAALVGLHPYF